MAPRTTNRQPRKIHLDDDGIYEVLNTFTPVWTGCFDRDFIDSAQAPKTTARNNMFGIIMNEPFIEHNGSLKSLSEIYDVDTASSITGLLIYRLGNPMVRNKPRVARI